MSSAKTFSYQIDIDMQSLVQSHDDLLHNLLHALLSLVTY